MSVRAVSDRGIHTMSAKNGSAKGSTTYGIKQLSNYHLNAGTIVCKARQLTFDPKEGINHAVALRDFVRKKNISKQDVSTLLLGYFLANDKRVYAYIQFKSEKKVFPAKLASLAWKLPSKDLEEWKCRINQKCDGDPLAWERLKSLGLVVSVSRDSETVKIPVADARYLRTHCLPKLLRQKKKPSVFANIQNEGLKEFCSQWEITTPDDSVPSQGQLFKDTNLIMSEFKTQGWISHRWIDLAGKTPEGLDRHWMSLADVTNVLSNMPPPIIAPIPAREESKKKKTKKTKKTKKKRKKQPEITKKRSKQPQKKKLKTDKQPKKKPAMDLAAKENKNKKTKPKKLVQKKITGMQKRKHQTTDANPSKKKKNKKCAPPPDGEYLSNRFYLDEECPFYRSLDELRRALKRENKWVNAMEVYPLRDVDVGKLASVDSRTAWGQLMQVLRKRDSGNFKILGELCVCFSALLFREKTTTTTKKKAPKKKDDIDFLFACLSKDDDEEEEEEEEEEASPETWHEKSNTAVVLVGMYDMWKSNSPDLVEKIMKGWAPISEIGDPVEFFGFEKLASVGKDITHVRQFYLGLFDACFPTEEEEEKKPDELTTLIYNKY